LAPLSGTAKPARMVFSSFPEASTILDGEPQPPAANKQTDSMNLESKHDINVCATIGCDQCM
jgi:hypothetical protein